MKAFPPGKPGEKAFCNLLVMVRQRDTAQLPFRMGMNDRVTDKAHFHPRISNAGRNDRDNDQLLHHHAIEHQRGSKTNTVVRQRQAIHQVVAESLPDLDR